MNRLQKSASEGNSYKPGTIRLFQNAPGIRPTEGKMPEYWKIQNKIDQCAQVMKAQHVGVYIDGEDCEGVAVFYRDRSQGLFADVPEKLANKTYVVHCVWTDKAKYLDDAEILKLYKKYKHFRSSQNTLAKSKSLDK